MANLHLVSWNVNGIRAIAKKNFFADVQSMDPDILCLQETKAQSEEVKKVLGWFPNHHVSANDSKTRKGYSGTAILSKQPPIKVTYDIGVEEYDKEGRVITFEHENFFIVNVYVPNSGEKLKRLDYREQWDVHFRKYLMLLETKKPVILCGDMNVAHTEMDIARPKPNYNKSAGYTQKEIDGLSALLDACFIDSFRHFCPEKIVYSWWNYKFRARERNVGWRIDYFLVSKQLDKQMVGADIYTDIMGSDHCPVALKLSIK